METALRAKDEDIRKIRSGYEKEKAIQLQKETQFTTQIQDLKHQIESNKKVQLNAMEAMEETSGHRPDVNKQLDEMRETFEQKLKRTNQEFERQKTALSSKINDLTEANDDLNDENQRMGGSYELERSELQSKLEKMTDRVRRVEDENESLGNQKTTGIKALEEALEKRIVDLETELENVKNNTAVERSQIHHKSEENLKGLKSCYESEKERLERKLIEEKDKHERGYNNMVEDYESRLKNEKASNEEAVENMQEELKNYEVNLIGRESQHVQ
jgi:chromosome segregation ATPase